MKLFIISENRNIITLVLMFSMIIYCSAGSLKKKTEKFLPVEKSEPQTLELEIPQDKNLVFSNDYNHPFYYKSRWPKMFKIHERPSSLCSQQLSLIPKNKTEVFVQKDEWLNSILPKKKVNQFKIDQHGFGDSAYLFDWLDGFLQEDVTNKFKEIIKKARELSSDPQYPDIYSALNQLDAFKSLGANQNFVKPNEIDTPEAKERIIEALSKINRNVKPNVFKTGITISQLSLLLPSWKWVYNSSLIKWQKILFDQYDFDGDGRLNASEFILLSIVYNYYTKKLGTPVGENVYFELTREKIDGLFNFADCNADGFVSAEELWYTAKKLKRTKDIGKYDIFKCNAYKPMENEYRSAASNDFILKNDRTVEGLVNLEEFRMGILLGYWNRQIDALDPVGDNSLNEKSLRWGADGHLDLKCEQIKATQSVSKNLG